MLHCNKKNPKHYLQAWVSAVCSSHWNLFQYLAEPLENGRHSIIVNVIIDYKSMVQSPGPSFLFPVHFVSAPYISIWSRYLHPDPNLWTELFCPYFSDIAYLLLHHQLQIICAKIPFAETQFICWNPQLLIKLLSSQTILTENTDYCDTWLSLPCSPVWNMNIRVPLPEHHNL